MRTSCCWLQYQCNASNPFKTLNKTAVQTYDPFLVYGKTWNDSSHGFCMLGAYFSLGSQIARTLAC